MVCPSHGLRYDPAVHSGCLRCRKAAASAPMSAVAPAAARAGAGSARNPRVLALGGAALAVVLVVVVVVLFARGRAGGPAAPVAGVAVSGGKEQLAAYIETVRRLERELPLAQSREAMEGLAADAQARRLDVRGRLAKLNAVRQTLAAQRESLLNTPAPEPAAVLRGVMLDWFGRMGAMIGTLEQQVRTHEDVMRLVARKSEITNREQAQSLADEFAATSRRIKDQMATARRLQAEAGNLSTRKRQEEERLVREHGLSLAPDEAAAQRASPEEAMASSEWCKSILQMGGTLADCKAAIRPDPGDFPSRQ